MAEKKERTRRAGGLVGLDGSHSADYVLGTSHVIDKVGCSRLNHAQDKARQGKGRQIVEDMERTVQG